MDTRNLIPTLYITTNHREPDPYIRDGIWRSESGGVEWESIHNTEIPTYVKMCNISIHPYYQDTLYTCFRFHGAARSVNRGETWEIVPTDSAINLKVRYRDGGYGVIMDNHIKPHIEIVNQKVLTIHTR